MGQHGAGDGFDMLRRHVTVAPQGRQGLGHALQLDPSYGRARNNLAFSLAALGRDEEALATFRVALDEQYGFDQEILEANAHYNLGLAQASRGDQDHARQSYREALAIIPEHARAQAALDDLIPNKEAN